MIVPARQSRILFGAVALLALERTQSYVPELSYGMPRLDGVGIALAIAFLVISLSLHEVAHGWVALKRGDPTAQELGRISFNPLVHVDPLMTVVLPALLYMTSGLIFGGAKPVPVVAARLRHPLRDMMLVALAGPLTNLLLAFVFISIYKAVLVTGLYDPGQQLPRVILASAMFNVLLAVFNLVPVPPLDGSRVLSWLLPPSLREPYNSLERFGMLLVLCLVFFVPGFQRLLYGGLDTAVRLLDTLTLGTW